MNQKFKIILFAFLISLLLLFAGIVCAGISGSGKIKVYFFWGDGCPHCEKEKPYLDELKLKYPEIEIAAYEVWHNRENARLFGKTVKAFGIESVGVPATFIGDLSFVGFSENMKKKIEDRIKFCRKFGCMDALENTGIALKQEDEPVVALPFLGKIDASKVSLPAYTVILGLLDSFNPCAFFVLFFLLSLLIHARSRKRMLLIGGTFVFFSGFVYFLFMSAWLNFFLLVGQLVIITLIAGIIALTVASINIKDFFYFKKGVSLSISESAKPRLFERMRTLVKATSVSSMLAGTVVLATAANMYEFLCTAGFPMVFTRILTLHRLPAPEYYLYLVLYNVIYVLPLIAIVLVFIVTFGTRKITEWQGRVLKLVSGLMMLGLGLILLIKPALLNNVFMAAGLLIATLILSGIIVVVTKRVNPELTRV